jgi:chromosome segregation protein
LRIRSLEIAGFKSFAQRATLVFQGGISAIVGPNGCGKSNVVDAIRWVMGEQNPRHMRGRRMEDVIFGGTQTTSPSGMAEVIMTLDNSDGTAPGDFREFREIEIARRLYRSGESEYLINKVPVRLRDVLDFFLDTGIGTRGYTIVEQGAIAGIVSSKPEERRMIFEEASGIGKYRARRAEALSKLRSTEQNLTRVNDVLSELQRQTDSLERQAKKARRHKELSAKVRDLELAVTCESFASGEIRSREWEGELEARRTALVDIEARHARLEADLETERHQHLERDRALAQSSEGLFKIRAEIQSLESRFAFERREHASLEALVAQRAQEIGELEERLELCVGDLFCFTVS